MPWYIQPLRHQCAPDSFVPAVRRWSSPTQLPPPFRRNRRNFASSHLQAKVPSRISPAWRTHPSKVWHERFGRYDTVFSLVGSEPTTTAEDRSRITRSLHGYKCDRTRPTIGPLVDTATSPKTVVFLVLFSKAGWNRATLSPRIFPRSTLQHRVLESTIPIECH